MKKKLIGLVIGMIVILGVAGLTVHNRQDPSTTTSQSGSSSRSVKVKKIVSPVGKWQGVKQYDHHQSVTLTMTFKPEHRYQLVESNTVSQCWTRTYTGSYQRNKNQITCVPQQVVVQTFTSKQTMKTQQPSATETVTKDMFYKQFGNQQHSHLVLQQKGIKISHDHETIMMMKE